MGSGFANDAARNAYLAAFHAAQAFIIQHAGRAAKTHTGAHTQFAQLARHERGISDEMRLFLPRAFRLKALADYEFGKDTDIPAVRAAATAEQASRFVEGIAALLDAPNEHRDHV